MSNNLGNNKIILVDGSSYLFRAFHALPPLVTQTGQPTGAIYGMLTMLLKLIANYPDSKIIVVFDSKGKNFRHEVYSEYKANRTEMDSSLEVQIPYVFEIIDALGLPLVKVPGIEADDLIGTLSKVATDAGLEVIISSNDKDLTQLINNNCVMINSMTDVTYDEAYVKEKFGVHTSQIIDYLTLVGDSVDNIPGVPGVGPKTAAKFLGQYGNLDEIVKHSSEIKGKVGESLRSSIPQFPMVRELVTVKTNIDMDCGVLLENVGPRKLDRLKELYKELEFKSLYVKLASEFDNNQKKDFNISYSDFKTIWTEEELRDLISLLNSEDIVAFDTETDSLFPVSANLVGLSFATKQKAFYIPVGHVGDESDKQLKTDIVIDCIKPLFNNSNILFVAHNLKYDLIVLSKYGVKFTDNISDTLLCSYVLNSNKKHNLDAISMELLGHKMISYDDVTIADKKRINFSEVDIFNATKYSAEDAYVTLKIYEILIKQLSTENKLNNVLCNIEVPLIKCLADMEMKGVLVSKKFLENLNADFQNRINELEREAFEEAGTNFNLSSPKQLQTIFFEKNNFPIIEKTPKGQPSTAEHTLQILAKHYKLPAIILEHRALSKLVSTYTSSLPKEINLNTGRIHTSFSQSVTSTGRLSSSNPNLQNIPIKSIDGKRIREAFIAQDGYKLVSADYSQIELRITAYMSKDEKLLQAFRNGEDIHKLTASQVFEVPISNVTEDQRRQAKIVNFGLIYGMSAYGLSQNLDISVEKSQFILDRYFSQFPSIKTYMDAMKKFASTHGYVETIFGRRLYLPDIRSSNRQKQAQAQRAAINAPVQGTQADIIKLAMIEIHKKIKNEFPESNMILQVHDELVFEVKESDIDKFCNMIKSSMENIVPDMNLIVDVGIGSNWNEAH